MKTPIAPSPWPVSILPLLLAANLASACYDPGLQRWINRDPVGEAGLPHCSQREVGTPRNVADGTFACPCTALVVNCVTSETCEPVQVGVGTEAPLIDYYWVPHRRCARCPEGRYGNY